LNWKDINWQNFTEAMHDKGYAVIPQVLTAGQCEELKAGYTNPDLYRKR